MGLCYIAAALRQAGADCRILDLAARLPEFSYDASRDDITEIVTQELRDQPALIGIGPLVTATLRATQMIIRTCRSRSEAPVVVGGPLCAVPGVSKVMREYLQPNWYVAGDGETPSVELWRAMRSGRTPSALGLATPEQCEPAPYREMELDALALPARDLLSERYHASARRSSGIGTGSVTPAFLSRGCPYSCTFCAAPLSSGKTVRRLSTAAISRELADISKLGYEHIVFYDDCLFIRSPHLDSRVLEFASAVLASPWRGTFQLELRCDAVVALSNSALEALQTAGCIQINMGIEKAHADQLALFQKRLKPEIATAAVERLRNTRIRAAGTFILGGPGESSSEVEQTIDFAVASGLDFAHFNPLAIYPGTQLFSDVYGATSNWLELCLDPTLAPHGDILWNGPGLPMSGLVTLLTAAYHRFYTTERLSRLSGKLDNGTFAAISDAYAMLKDNRAASWSHLSKESVKGSVC
jgi:anaerobic magnesium-protoporphyrin IX monomethyl ester cyclase